LSHICEERMVHFINFVDFGTCTSTHSETNSTNDFCGGWGTALICGIMFSYKYYGCDPSSASLHRNIEIQQKKTIFFRLSTTKKPLKYLLKYMTYCTSTRNSNNTRMKYVKAQYYSYDALYMYTICRSSYYLLSTMNK
jgi:hypothetical protein